MFVKTSSFPRTCFLFVLFECVLLCLLSPCALAQELKLEKLGVIFPLTGAASEFGTEMLESLELLTRLENDKRSRNLQLVVEDSKTSAQQALSAYQARLASADIPVLFSDLSSVSLALAPLSSRKKQLMFAVAATSKLSRYKYTVRAYPEAATVAQSMLAGLEQIGIKAGAKLAIFAIEDEFGQSVSEHLLRKVQDSSASAKAYQLSTETYLGNTDLASLALRRRKADAYLVIGYGPPMGLLIRELRKTNPSAHVIGSLELGFDSAKSLLELPDAHIHHVDLELSSSKWTKDFSKRLGRSLSATDVIMIKCFFALLEAVELLQKEGTAPSGDQIWQKIAGSTFSRNGVQSTFSDKGDMQLGLTLKSCGEGC